MGVNIDSDAFPVLLNSPYRCLPVERKIVIDIGANIGDSSIYFALQGASKVIGVEPFPQNYETANKNIKLNELSHIITMLLSGCARHSGFITVDPDQKCSVSTKLTVGAKYGIRIPLLTSEDILDQNNIPSHGIVLKMDCEGCEYENLLSTSKHILRRFSHMLIEYHYGYKNIKEKLEQSGFTVSITNPEISRSDRSMRFGYILAKLS